MRLRCVRAVGALMLAAATAGAQPEPLPATPPAGGVVWSIVVPALLFSVALGATVMLYRHFARRDR